MALSLVSVPVFAEDEMASQETANTETITFEVNGLNFNTIYEVSDYNLVCTNEDGAIKYTIYDLNNEFVEAWSFDLGDLLELNSNRRTTTNISYKNYKDIGAFNGELIHQVVINVYSSGSFHQFNEFVHDQAWIEGWAYYNLESFSSDIRPQDAGGWPTQILSVEYLATVKAEIDISLQGQVEAELIGADFSLGGSVGSTVYYSKGFRTTYTIE